MRRRLPLDRPPVKAAFPEATETMIRQRPRAVKADATSVTVIRDSGKSVTIPLTMLTPDDWDFVAETLAAKQAEASKKPMAPSPTSSPTALQNGLRTARN